MAKFQIKEKEAFFELQSKLVESSRQLNSAKLRITAYEKEKRRATLTLQELKSLPPTTRTFAAAGKMFIITPNTQLQAELEAQLKKYESELQTLQSHSQYLEKQIVDCEKSIKELLVSTG